MHRSVLLLLSLFALGGCNTAEWGGLNSRGYSGSPRMTPGARYPSAGPAHGDQEASSQPAIAGDFAGDDGIGQAGAVFPSTVQPKPGPASVERSIGTPLPQLLPRS